MYGDESEYEALVPPTIPPPIPPPYHTSSHTSSLPYLLPTIPPPYHTSSHTSSLPYLLPTIPPPSIAPSVELRTISGRRPKALPLSHFSYSPCQGPVSKLITSILEETEAYNLPTSWDLRGRYANCCIAHPVLPPYGSSCYVAISSHAV